MTEPGIAALHRIRDSVAMVGRLSDGLVRLGPLGIGLDGVLSWVPGVGEAYGAAAGAFLVIQGARAGVSVPLLLGAAAMMSVRTSLAAVPLIGPVFADLFTAHSWSARMIVRAIDRKLAGQGRGEAWDSGASWRVRAA